jgi:abortive infection bacteriophage resistance protein
MKFAKPPFTHEQQLDQLVQRGLVCTDRAKALHYLGHLNYYRLGAYWLPFEIDHTTHTFQFGTCFDDVLNLYIFDRELRLMVLDAIERVEVSVRTGWAYTLAHRYGPHAHLNTSLFKNPARNWDHAQQSQKLEAEARKSHETFLQHHYQKYDEPLPPLWAVVEVMTLGQLSKWYSNLRHGADRNAVARCYDMDETNLTSFLHHLSTIRNICAHHSRLWNREFTFTFRLPTHRPQRLAASLNYQDDRRLYNTLAVLAWLLDSISPQHQWKQRLKALLVQHQIDPLRMGFPAGWQQMPIWQDAAL